MNATKIMFEHDPDWALTEIRAAFSYDPNTGALRARKRRRGPQRERAGTRRPDGYRSVSFNGRPVLEHRLIWFIYHGRWPDGILDHINRVRDDNRIENLREATHSLNTVNSGVRCDNALGATGVTEPSPGKFLARIWRDGGEVWRGWFDCVDHATAARDAEIRRRDV